ncbi:MAG: hypothetical protein M3T49_09990, partial [Candidatus Eremiobacteraeota bacterium]|nr:hypothetical protein [Candidatus Eremiobacteraeota bacterium]
DVLVLPSLGQVIHGGPKLVAFLSAYNVLYIWYYVVEAIALEQVLKVKRPAAIATVVVMSLLGAGYAALVAR